VPIQDLPLRLLLVLLERPRSVISRDELRQRLWGDTVIDFDAGLNTAVRKLRDALGDNADSPRLLETVPRRGYRLHVDVDPIVEPVAVPAAGDSGAGWKVKWAAATAIAAISLVWLTLSPSHSSRRILVVPFQSVVADQALADELTAEVISQVARLAPARLEVLGPMTSRRFRSMADSPDIIERQTGATELLTGRILREGDRVRVTVSLARTSDGVAIWSHVLEPGAGSLHAITTAVVTNIVRCVGLTMNLS
jgi:TolB-like protein